MPSSKEKQKKSDLGYHSDPFYQVWKNSIKFWDTYRSMSLDFMMWFFAAVTFHDPKVKSCLLLLKPCNIIAKRDTNNKTIRWFKNVLMAENKTVLVSYPQKNISFAYAFAQDSIRKGFICLSVLSVSCLLKKFATTCMNV